MPTTRLYYENPYQTEFTAVVRACTPARNGWAVVLDQTAFYPEGGGQPCDLGTLGGVHVTDVHERDGVIVHSCDGPLSGEVSGQIDWARRFDLMQQHAGEHLLSGLVHSRYGYDNVGFHMGAEAITVDFNGPIPPEALPELEDQVNRWIWENRASEILWPSEAALQALPYRSKKALTGPVRIVHYPGIDMCACCGTHVARTGEIGLLKILSCVKFHQGVRLEILCGGRAFAYLRRMFDQNREISGLLSAKLPETGRAVRRMQQELSDTTLRLNQWKTRCFAELSAQLCRDSAAQTPLLLFEATLTPADLQQLCLLLMEKTTRLCAVFSGSDADGWKYAIGQRDGNLRALVQQFNLICNGRGGGKPQLCQGSVSAAREAIEGFFATLPTQG